MTERGKNNRTKGRGSVLAGATAGLLATVPMTVVMLVMHRALPWRERYPLPPEEITVAVADRAGLEEAVNAPLERLVATLAGHFAYGALSGLLYAPLAERVAAPPAVKGATFGLAVWGGSYLGWLPAAHILRPATEHPARRTTLMVVAHLVWGSATGVILDRLTSRASTPSSRPTETDPDLQE